MIGHYTWAHLVVFLAGVAVCLIVDLRAHTRDEAVSAKNALLWSLFWITLALGFAVYIALSHGTEDASLFVAGYLLEKSLSVDNLFVIMAIFSSFAVKDEFQHRVLYYGILGALVLRMVFVAAGSSVLVLFGPYALGGFGLFVLWSAWKMWQQMGRDEEDIEDYTNHWAVSWTRKCFPVHHKMDGHNFFVRVQDGALVVRKATPLFLCLVVVEISDIMFAFDSVPAVIAITREPFLIYTSNIFAILGLRSLFFLLAAAKRYLCHLEKAVIVILVYIGLKMLLDVAGFIHMTPMFSLAVVCLLLAGGVLASLVWPEKDEA
ncbi:MAG: TerC/Alx family metal homeostasis membrane protein [Desulfovibrionaceae bacterium]|nr:TerC/Alx family metal homeostasis membrane protein [Desulfovibrionaceae bacterium]